MTASNKPSRLPTSVLWLAAAVALPGLAALFAATIPSEFLHSVAERSGHADDVNLERIARLRVVGVGLAMAHFLWAGWLVTAGRHAATIFLSSIRQELISARPIAGVLRFHEFATKLGWLHAATLLLVLLAAAWLRLHYLNVPMDYDESYSFLNYARRPLYQGLADYNSTNNHLLNTLCMHVAYLGFGPQEWALRLPGFVAGIALVGCTYLLGRNLHSPEAGLLAAALVASSDVMVNYSVNARGYIWEAWMSVLLVWAFWRIASAEPAPLLADWMGAWMAAVIGIFALPTMVYSVAGCAAWLGASILRHGQQARHRLAGLQIWILLVALATAWLYAAAVIFRGISAWQHPFVSAQPFGQWLARVPATWFLALKSWSEGPVPWFVPCVLLALGLVALGIAHRGACGLLFSIILASFLIMALQRVSPPPRVLSFLAPLFAFGAAVGLVEILRLISYEYELDSKGSRPTRLTSNVLCSVIAGGLCIAAAMGSRKEPLPGGLYPSFLIEDVGEFWAKVQVSSGIGARNQLWRLDVEAAVQMLEPDLIAGDRVLVGLPADLPFHFYATRHAWTIPIGGQPMPTERLFLVIKAGENPRTAVQDNPSLQLRDSWLLKADWQLVTSGELAIWQAQPASAETTESSSR